MTMNKLIRYFLNGCLAIVPVAVSIYVIVLIFVEVDDIIPAPIPGLGFILTIGVVTGIGWLTTQVMGKRVVGWTDDVMGKTPLVKLIYTSIRDFMAALMGDKKKLDKPCVVSLNAEGTLRVFGFITREDLSDWGLSDTVAVYMPQSINFAGQLGLFPRERVQPLEVEASQILPFIVSGGFAGKQAPGEAVAGA